MHSDIVSTSGSDKRDRKRTKPLMEKRRRARINASLGELKSLLLETSKNERSIHSKMEKADILEMTVKHLRDLQGHPFTGSSDPTIKNRQRLGFTECTQEVSRYLSNIDGCDLELRTRLLDHLANSGILCGSPAPHETSLPVPNSPPPPSVSPLPIVSSPERCQHDARTLISSDQKSPLPQSAVSNHCQTDMNNNTVTLPNFESTQTQNDVRGIQVIPTKLQTGEIAFVLPGNVIGCSQIPSYIIPLYTPSHTSPVKSTDVMSSDMATPGSFMTIVPSTNVIQTCSITQRTVNSTHQYTPSQTSSTSTSVTPSHTSTSSCFAVSPTLCSNECGVRHVHVCEERHDDVSHMCGERHPDVSDIRGERHDDDSGMCEDRHRDVRDIHVERHDAGDIHGERHDDVRVKCEEHNHNVRGMRAERNPVVRDLREHNLFMDTVWRPW